MKKSEIKNILSTHRLCNINYQKVNGEMRHAEGTLMESEIPHNPKHTENEKHPVEPVHIVRYWDINSGGWRTFLVDSLVSISGVE